jgi:hypothetical protein
LIHPKCLDISNVEPFNADENTEVFNSTMDYHDDQLLESSRISSISSTMRKFWDVVPCNVSLSNANQVFIVGKDRSLALSRPMAVCPEQLLDPLGRSVAILIYKYMEGEEEGKYSRYQSDSEPRHLLGRSTTAMARIGSSDFDSEQKYEGKRSLMDMETWSWRLSTTSSR